MRTSLSINSFILWVVVFTLVVGRSRTPNGLLSGGSTLVCFDVSGPGSSDGGAGLTVSFLHDCVVQNGRLRQTKRSGRCMKR